MTNDTSGMSNIKQSTFLTLPLVTDKLSVLCKDRHKNGICQYLLYYVNENCVHTCLRMDSS